MGVSTRFLHRCRCRSWACVCADHVAADGVGRLRVPHVVLVAGVRLRGRDAQGAQSDSGGRVRCGQRRGASDRARRRLAQFRVLQSESVVPVLDAGFRRGMVLEVEGRCRACPPSTSFGSVRGAVVFGAVRGGGGRVGVPAARSYLHRAARVRSRAQLRRERADAVLRVLRVPRRVPGFVAALRPTAMRRRRATRKSS